MKTYIGIDNGLDGATVGIDQDGHILFAFVHPTQIWRKGREIDINEYQKILIDKTAICESFEGKIIFEEPGGAQSYKAAVSMAASFHALRGFIESSCLPWERITPAQWQRKMLPGCKAKETKPRALELARRLWPDRDWRASERCRKPHDGLIDAALIAEWARRENL